MQAFESNLKGSGGTDFFVRGSVIALVHGLGEHSGRYPHGARALTGAGYALAGFDLRGRPLNVRPG